MKACSERTRAIRFDSFEMDLIARELRKNGRKVRLQPQPFLILQHLALQAREPVLREELYSYLSAHGSYDSKQGLNNAIEKIRKALRDSPKKPRFVETLRDCGYRFLKEVEFIPQMATGSNHEPALSPDLFLAAVNQFWREFLITHAPQKLSNLFYRVLGLLDQYREHPNKSEAGVLLEGIQAARSENNLAKHKISFDSAALALKDPYALRIYRPSIHELPTWNTLGRVQRGVGGLWRPVILVVSQEIYRYKGWISSARKATPSERAAYEQKTEKTDQ